MIFYDIIGLFGASLVLIAYFLLLTKKISAENLSHAVLNLVGGVMILYSLLYAWNLSAVIIELAWISLSVYGIFKWVIKKYSA
jgi:hypothetical protein